MTIFERIGNFFKNNQKHFETIDRELKDILKALDRTGKLVNQLAPTLAEAHKPLYNEVREIIGDVIRLVESAIAKDKKKISQFQMEILQDVMNIKTMLDKAHKKEIPADVKGQLDELDAQFKEIDQSFRAIVDAITKLK